MANPSGNNNDSGGDHSYHGGSSVPEPGLQHNTNTGASSDWTQDEQSILEDGLAQYASESNIIRYAKIAVQLQNKTVRDVAMRCRWMVKRENSKRRNEDYFLTRKSKDRKEIINEHSASSSHITQTGPSSYFHGVVADQKSNAIHSVLVSPAGQLLQESAQALDRVSANLETHQLQQLLENISLLCQIRKNIVSILTNFKDTPDTLKQLPPFLVKLNEDLLNSLLPPATLQQMQ
ncbi:uncharacterized protein [Rutidosis leptorrhynchoides]|uniref:uncharacterized protein n=1 Tax=Rutidosis leptorrhynchoides TaxID=125765 RepID=UPI003A99711F